MASLLGSLLDDFDHWFARGEELLSGCSEDQLSDSEQRDLSQRLKEGQQAIAATRALVAATDEPMAVSMEAMKPWHDLVTDVSGLAARTAKRP